MLYEKQHQNCLRKVNEVPQTLHKENFKMDPKSMRTIVKTDLKVETNEVSASYCPSATKELVFFGICLNLARRRVKLFFQTKNIHCGAKVQSTKHQSAGRTLRGHS